MILLLDFLVYAGPGGFFGFVPCGLLGRLYGVSYYQREYKGAGKDGFAEDVITIFRDFHLRRSAR